jgi:membrane associated rhomboid family serine protease
LLIVLAAIAAIDSGLWLRDSTVAWYVGSSGALHGVMAAGTLAHLRRRDFDGWILAAFILLKLSYEQWTGALPFAESGAGVVVDAHLYGALGGLAVAAFLKPRPEPL